jgi:hypothetical protein
MPLRKVFLLSPASTSGKRAELLFSARARFELAHRLQEGGSAPIREVFSFLSGLYFRGKLAYAEHFARSGSAGSGILVITPDRGLVSPTMGITIKDLRSFAKVPVDLREPRYRAPLERDMRALAEHVSGSDQVVLLGSVATGKYIDVMLPLLGERLVFPEIFVGLGDMSRGSIMLKSVRADVELSYVPVGSAVRSLAKGSR